jgi:ketosteroid isomerase-like protein
MTLAERVQWMVEARNRGEIDAVLDHYLPDAEWTPEDVVEQGERVVASIRYEARGRGSGVALSGTLHGVTTFRDGKVARVEMFDSRADAERAAAAPLRE